MKKPGHFLLIVMLLLNCTACSQMEADPPVQPPTTKEANLSTSTVLLQQVESTQTETEGNVTHMTLKVGENTWRVTLSENTAVDSFVEMVKRSPVVIQMRDYSGFEKVGSLGVSLKASDSQMHVSAGDIVLYNGNQIVVFYGTHSWSYTKLGRIEDLTGWKEALGSGDVEVTFQLEQGVPGL